MTALLIAMLAACSSSNVAVRPAEVAQAEVRVNLRAPLMFGSSRTAPASFDVIVRNPAKVDVRVRRIGLSSPAMMDYAIQPVVRTFNDVIPPGGTKTFSVLAEAVSSTRGLTPSEPLNIRAEVDFEAGERRFREIYTIMSTTVR
jgi:hypothetical protein